MTTTSKKGKHAVVIGASMAGLLATRALSDAFEKVTILERDTFSSEARKGVPQGRHAHGLLATGWQVMTEFFPRFEQELIREGAEIGDSTGDGLWFQNGGYLIQTQSKLRAALMSRPRLESKVRARVLSLANVIAKDHCDVLGLITNDDKSCVTGVRIQKRDQGRGEESLYADLVVDATGRGSRSPAWLEQLGYAKPECSEIKINMHYASRSYRRSENDLNGNTHLIVAPNAPYQKRGGVLLAQEDNRWIVTLIGMVGENVPTDEGGFLEFARSLPTPDLYNVLSKAEPLSDITPYAFPASLRRHYEKLSRFPEGYLVFGDALCSFNPIYGQGMTTAALETKALHRCLEKGLAGLAKRFFKESAKVIDTPWTLAAGADFGFPETEGKRPPQTNFINRYIGKLLSAAWHDPVLAVAFHRVSNLAASPGSLFAPNIVLRVLRGSHTAPTPRLSLSPLKSQHAGD
jgi:2-polyprenyl-6-methoxyphenol hydroxylase-like FAD-dependent oxidoreductase